MKDKIASLIVKIGSVPVRDKESLLKKKYQNTNT